MPSADDRDAGSQPEAGAETVRPAHADHGDVRAIRAAGGPWPTAATRIAGLLGWPARHSLSPPIHNAAFRELGLDIVYVALPTPPDQLVEVVATLAAVECAGANVTVPHKQAVARLCDRLTPEAELVGAVNTLRWDANGLLGDNTDAHGLEEVLRVDLGVSREDAMVLLGTGGAARAAAVAAGRVGAPVTVVGRRVDAAQDVADLAAAAGSREVDAVDLDAADWVVAALARCRVAVNATPLGMGGEPLPAPFHQLQPGQVALDLVYTPPETPFLAAARVRGAAPHSGLGMLVAQAAASFHRWTGQPAPLATMSAVAAAAVLGDRY